MPKPDHKTLLPGESDNRLAITEAHGRIRNLKWKIKNKPDHSNVTAWQAQIDELSAHILNCREELVKIKYAPK